MKSGLIFKLFSPFQPLIPISLLRNLTKQRLIIPFYHTVSDEYLPHIHHLYRYKNIAQFEQDLDWLCDHYEPVSMSAIWNAKQNKKPLPKNAFHLTFDDGLRQCMDVIAPILHKRKIPATFFINSACIDNQTLMFRYKISLLIEKIKEKIKDNSDALKSVPLLQHKSADSMISYIRSLTYHQMDIIDQVANQIHVDFNAFLSDHKPYMTSTDIQTLTKMGFHVGSHSIDHPHYYELTLDQQLYQTLQGHKQLKEHINQPLNLFAFPFTDHKVSSHFFETIHADGGIHLSFGGAGLKNEKIQNHLQRIAGEDKRYRPLSQIVKTEYLYYLLKVLFRKNTIHRNDEN